MEKHKFASISLTVRDRAISSKFSTHRVSKKCTLGNFQKIFLSPKMAGYLRNVLLAIFKKFSSPPKMAAILNFRIFLPKMEKHKFASISLTLQDRAILSKFFIHRVSKQCTFGNVQKKFSLPKNGGHFEFSNFCPKCKKHKFASISLTMRDRAITSKFSTHRVSQHSTLANFVQDLEQNSCFPLGGHYACQCVLFLVFCAVV